MFTQNPNQDDLLLAIARWKGIQNVRLGIDMFCTAFIRNVKYANEVATIPD